MTSNYKRDLKVYKSIRNRIGFIAVVALLGTIATSIAGGVAIKAATIPDKTFSISYTSEGVDPVWLESHPFITDDLPTEVTTGRRTFLPSPHIDGYTFSKWSGAPFCINKKGIRPSKFEDDSYHYSLVAKYRVTSYIIKLHLDGGSLGLFDKTHDGHEYSSRKDDPTTNYTCLDDTFELPTPKKSGYSFSPSGWRIVGTNQYITHCNTSICDNLDLVAEWFAK